MTTKMSPARFVARTDEDRIAEAAAFTRARKRAQHAADQRLKFRVVRALRLIGTPEALELRAKVMKYTPSFMYQLKALKPILEEMSK